MPPVATVVMISCLNTWNEFLMAMLFIVDPRMKTLPVGTIAFEQAHTLLICLLRRSPTFPLSLRSHSDQDSGS